MTPIKKYKVKSSNGKDFYIVSEYPDGRFSCECKFYEFKGHRDPIGTCKHIKKVIKKYEN